MCGLIAKVVKAQRQFRHIFANQRHHRLQVVTLGAIDPDGVPLDAGLHLDFAVFDQALNFFGGLGLDAIAHLDHLLDLVAANFLHRAFVQEAHIDIAFGQFVAQDFVNLIELEVCVPNQGDLFVFEFNRRGCAFEVKTGGDFLGRVVHGVFHLDQIGFTNGIK